MSLVNEQMSLIDNFYKRKQEYDDKYEGAKYRILKDDSLSKSDKRQRLTELKSRLKCINCKKNGGTNFVITNTELSAKCGASPPCDLNINIDKGIPVRPAPEQVKLLSKSILDEQIYLISTKIENALGLISDEEAVTLYETGKQSITEKNYELTKLEEHIISLTENVEKQEEINQERVLLFTAKTEYQQILQRYKDERRISLLQEAVRILKDDIMPKAKRIRNLKYVVNKTIEDQETGEIKLIQEPYTLNQMEMPLAILSN